MASRVMVDSSRFRSEAGSAISISVTPTLAARMDLAASLGWTFSWPAAAALFSISSISASASATMAGRLSGRILPNITRYSSGWLSPNCTWLSHILRISSSGCPEGAKSLSPATYSSKPAATTASNRPSLSPKWWYRVGADTPASCVIWRVETGAPADFASSSAAARSSRILGGSWPSKLITATLAPIAMLYELNHIQFFQARFLPGGRSSPPADRHDAGHIGGPGEPAENEDLQCRTSQE